MTKIYLILSCLLLSTLNINAQAISSNPSTIDFGVTMQHDSGKKIITIINNSDTEITVTKLKIYSPWFYTKDQSFNMAKGASKNIDVYFIPLHNVKHETELIVYTNSKLGHFNIHLSGQGRYKGSYYDSTENLYEETLKQTLKRIIAKNYISLGYNSARDKMFMNIDNQKTNGQGASVNTLECIYTGRTITSYVDRQDAQGGAFDFNTEHTWPQSLFSSSDPMVSDLHHLYPTDNTANGKRGNDPFGAVANASWTVGGSRSGGSIFEPRNEQKGRTARSMLYFAVRYQNYSNFLTSQEKELRDWVKIYKVNKTDSLRNEYIYTLQKNRNPFIDHPELLDRITSVSFNSVAKDTFGAAPVVDTVYIDSVKIGDTIRYQIPIFAGGNQTWFIDQITSSNADIRYTGQNGSASPGYATNISIIFSPQQKKEYDDSLKISFKNSSETRTIYFISKGWNIINGLAQASVPIPEWSIYPNPSKSTISIQWNSNTDTQGQLCIYNTEGRLIERALISKGLIEKSLAPGLYLITLEAGGQRQSKTVLIQ
jgi:hypothetical protein